MTEENYNIELGGDLGHLDVKEGEDFIVVRDPLAEGEDAEAHDWAVLVEKGEFKGLLARYRDIEMQSGMLEFTYEILHWDIEEDEKELDEIGCSQLLASILNVIVDDSITQKALDMHDMETGEYIEY